MVAALLPGAATPAAASGTPIKYVHDEAGRLVGVINTDGSAARYSYDKVGNVTAIARFTATQLSIVEFTPNAAPAGASVTIWGSGFSANPSLDTVKFNGTTASVGSADANKLVVTVPQGATSGTISVTVGASSATSLDPFTVGAGSGPAVTGFSPPAVAPGDQLTINGSGFDTRSGNDLVKLGGDVRGAVLTASATQLTVLVPDGIDHGPISVTTPGGSSTSSNELFALPIGFKGVNALSAERMSVGSSRTVSVSTPNKFAMIVFNGTEGERISLTSSTTAPVPISIWNPDGTYIASPLYPAYHEPAPLPRTGSYAIIVGGTSYTGSATVTLYDIPPDIGGAIAVDGATAQFSTTVPGQKAVYTFDGTQGQRIAFSGTLCREYTIFKPSGGALASGSSFGCLDLDLNPLPETGTYRIVVDPVGQALINNMTITLSTQVTGTLTPGVQATADLARAGQDAYYTFEGSQGDRIVLDNQSNIQMLTSIYNPDGSTLASPTYGFQEPGALQQTGTYTVWVNPPDGHTGTARVTLYNVSADVTGTIAVDGATEHIETSSPGQKASYTFEETQGHYLSMAGCTYDWVIYKPSGGQLGGGGGYGCNDQDFGSPLPETGPYRLVLDPQSSSLVNTNITLSEPVQRSMSLGGGTVNADIARAAQNARVTFDGAAGQHVDIQLSNLGTLVDIALFNPDGSTNVSTSNYYQSVVNLNNRTLPADGTYVLTVDPVNGAGSNVTAQVNQTPGTVAKIVLGGRKLPHRKPPARPDRPPRVEPAPRPYDFSPRDLKTLADRRQARILSRTWKPSAAPSWTPSRRDRLGSWTIDREESPWKTFRALRAPARETALSGQVLTVDGLPLKGVVLELDGHETTTDFAGRFLLRHVPAGHHELEILGEEANKGRVHYGNFEAGIDIEGGRTNVLDYTIWMTRLDTRHEVFIPRVTRHETVVTTPKIPGLELRIPEGKTIRDSEGKVVHKIGITPVPVDRPPFPLPVGVEVPIYFTVQPGGAEIEPYSESKHDGARLIYPNYTNQPPKSRVQFWNYEPEDEGWYIYGEGTVTDDGTQVVPDPDVSIYEFTGAMIGNWPQGFPLPPEIAYAVRGGFAGDPVDLGTGRFLYQKTDLYIPDTIPISVTRTYRPDDSWSRTFGLGTGIDYDMILSASPDYSGGDLVFAGGGRVHFTRINSGNGATDGVFEAQNTPTEFFGSRLTWNGNGWDLKMQDDRTYVFGNDGPLAAIRDRFGNEVTIARANNQPRGNITQVTSPHGHWIRFTYDSRNHVTKATDSAGRTVNYTYDIDRLATVQDAKGGVSHYDWDPTQANRILSITDARQIAYLTNEYDSGGRITKQTLANGGTYRFDYTFDGAGKITRTDVTDPRGFIRRVTIDSTGYPVSDIRALGTPEQQTILTERDPATDRILSVTDQLGRKTSFMYDAAGNTESITRLAGTAGAATTSFAYEPTFGQPTSITDPRQKTTDLDYDALGELTTVTDPTGRTTTYTYNSAGQVTSVTNNAQETTTFGYGGGRLTSITDPMGHTTSRFVDAAGRVTRLTDAAGGVTTAAFDPVNALVKLTDPLGNETSFDYDPNGNMTLATDAKGNLTTYTYDNMDMVATRKDALLRTETNQYDLNGNLTQFTDRKSQKTTYKYDGLNRLVFAGFGTGGTVQAPTYVSKTDYTFDGGDRITKIVDSISGTTNMAYNGLDEMTSQATPQGTVSYTYDVAGRRSTMTVPGQAALTYSYDDANRPTGLSRGTTNVSISYDGAGRRSSVALPGGVSENYGYDPASELTSITYKKGTATLGDLAYGYNALGLRNEVSGSYARAALPAAVATTIYNANNQLTKWGTATIAYDLNGNMTSDGTNTYIYDERNQLASIKASNKTNGTFTYDGLGRRIKKVVLGVTTQFLYDGNNVVQELSSTGTVSANLLTGLGPDEIFARSTSSATLSLLSEGLGSTLATADGTGTVQTSYTYEPFGKATSSGATSVVGFQFTGRENDGNGLQYSRARYYSPTYGRFISEDPAGLAGGDVDLYGYVWNSPMSYTDASGLAGRSAAEGAPSSLPPYDTVMGSPPGPTVGPGPAPFDWPPVPDDTTLGPLNPPRPYGPPPPPGPIPPTAMMGQASPDVVLAGRKAKYVRSKEGDGLDRFERAGETWKDCTEYAELTLPVAFTAVGTAAEPGGGTAVGYGAGTAAAETAPAWCLVPAAVRYFL